MVKRRNIAIGTVILAGISYAAGVLTAPKSGRETRRDLKRAALRAKTETERKLKAAYSDLSTQLDDLSAKAKKAGNKVSEEYNKTMKSAEIVRKKAREILSALHEGEAEDEDLQKVLSEVKDALKHLKTFAQK